MILIYAIEKKILPQDSIISNINHDLRTLLRCFPNYRKQIEKILILNFKNQKINSAEFENDGIIKSVGLGRGKNSDINREIIEIISNSVIINTYDFVPAINTNLIPIENGDSKKQNNLIDLIKKIVDSNKILFFGNRLSPRFARILLFFNDLIGFYSKSISGRGTFIEIQHPQKYLRMITQLNQLAGGIFSVDSKNYLPFLTDFKKNIANKKRKIIIYGGDKYLSDILILNFEQKGNFFKYDCIKGDYHIYRNSSIYIYDNFDSLSLLSRSRLVNKLIKEKTARYIILRSSTYIGDLSLSGFAKFQVPSIEKILPEIPSIFNRMINEKSANKKNGLNRKSWQRIIRSKALLEFYRSLRSLYELDSIIENVLNRSDKTINSGDLEFWYELLYGENLFGFQAESIQKETEKSLLNKDSLKEIIQMLVDTKESQVNANSLINSVIPKINNGPEDYIQDSDYPFQFLRRENNKLKIIFDGKDIALRNEDLLGLHYLRLIIKYGRNGMSYQEIENNYRDSIVEAKEKSQLEATDMMEGDEEDTSATLQPVESYVGYEYIDKTTLKMIKKEIERLEEKKAILESELNLDGVKSIDIELEKLHEYLNSSLNIKGESRTTNTELEKSKRRVKKAINIALKQIRIENLKFYSYLVKSIVPDKSKYIYIPDSKIDWILDL